MLFYESLWTSEPRTYRQLLNRRWLEWQQASSRATIAADVGAQFSPLQHTHAALILGSRTLLECFQRAFTFYNARNPHTQYRLDIESHRIRVTIQYPEHLAPVRDDAEYRLSLLASVIRWVVPMTGDELIMQFQDSLPCYHGELSRIMNSRMQFEAPLNALVICPRVMDAPIWGSDLVASSLGRLYEEDLSAFSVPRTLAARVAMAVRLSLQEGKSGIKSVAGQFGVSPRTLQRQLFDEGTSFQQVMEETKHRLCAELIQDPDIPVEEINKRLGYSNPSNFARAFRKWFGTTPVRLRRAMQAGPAGRP